ncbi:MAG: sterol desaturase family protein [Ginsengibacter sp.]|jgi:sterol desaturase/sphingolipid hydroxylase (fatty acid hydroxylase superfamily)
MELPDFSSPEWIVINTVIFFIVITGRYFLLSGLFYAIFYIWYPEKWKSRKINNREFKKGQLKTEIKWSMLSAAIFAVTAAATVIIWQKGYTKVYTTIALSDWWYFPLSLIIYMLLQETYYYWIHRWMHIPRIFLIVHKVHHDSKISSPFTAFSFHPIEALLQAVFIPVLLMIIPIHLYVIIALLTIMSLSSVVNHLDIEIYPEGSQNNFSKWVIGATHHAQHHQRYKYNFGLYFTIWDRLKKTESPDFNNVFVQKTKQQVKS